MYISILFSLLATARGLDINYESCVFKGEIYPVGQLIALPQKCAFVACYRATLNNRKIASLDVMEIHPGSGCCIGPDGSMIQDGRNITLTSGLEVTCWRGSWMQVVHVEPLEAATEKPCFSVHNTDVVLLSGGVNGNNHSLPPIRLNSVEVFGLDGYTPSLNLPESRFFHTSHFIDNRILFAGGLGTTGPRSSASKNVLQLLNGEFKLHSELSQARYLHKGLMLGGKLTLIGSAGPISDEELKSTETLTGTTWTKGKNAKYFVGGSCTVDLNPTTSLIIGGRRKPASPPNLDEEALRNTTEVFIFTTYEEGTWSETTSLPGYREGHSCTVLQNGDILVAGGLSGNMMDIDRKILNTAAIYQRSSNTWVALPGRMNFPRVYGQMVNVNGRILYFGGKVSKEGRGRAQIEKSTESIEEFKEDTQTWELLTATMDQPKYGFSAVVVPAHAIGC